MATLYEINDEILACVDPDTGEIIDEDRLAELQMDFDEKVENIACWIKNLLSDANGIKEERDALYKRETACRNKADTLKRYLKDALDGQKFNTPKVSISYRKSESVEVDSIMELPTEYLQFPEPTANKTEIKKALKAGEEITGARLIENQNIQIK